MAEVSFKRPVKIFVRLFYTEVYKGVKLFYIAF